VLPEITTAPYRPEYTTEISDTADDRGHHLPIDLTGIVLLLQLLTLNPKP